MGILGDLGTFGNTAIAGVILFVALSAMGGIKGIAGMIGGISSGLAGLGGGATTSGGQWVNGVFVPGEVTSPITTTPDGGIATTVDGKTYSITPGTFDLQAYLDALVAKKYGNQKTATPAPNIPPIQPPGLKPPSQIPTELGATRGNMTASEWHDYLGKQGYQWG